MRRNTHVEHLRALELFGREELVMEKDDRLFGTMQISDCRFLPTRFGWIFCHACIPEDGFGWFQDVSWDLN